MVVQAERLAAVPTATDYDASSSSTPVGVGTAASMVTLLNDALARDFVLTRNLDDDPAHGPSEGSTYMLPATVWSNKIFASTQAWPSARRVSNDPEVKSCCSGCLGLPFYDQKDGCYPMRWVGGCCGECVFGVLLVCVC